MLVSVMKKVALMLFPARLSAACRGAAPKGLLAYRHQKNSQVMLFRDSSMLCRMVDSTGTLS